MLTPAGYLEHGGRRTGRYRVGGERVPDGSGGYPTLSGGGGGRTRVPIEVATGRWAAPAARR